MGLRLHHQRHQTVRLHLRVIPSRLSAPPVRRGAFLINTQLPVFLEYLFHTTLRLNQRKLWNRFFILTRKAPAGLLAASQGGLTQSEWKGCPQNRWIKLRGVCSNAQTGAPPIRRRNPRLSYNAPQPLQEALHAFPAALRRHQYGPGVGCQPPSPIAAAPGQRPRPSGSPPRRDGFCGTASTRRGSGRRPPPRPRPCRRRRP